MDTEKLIELAEKAMSPIWDGEKMPPEYYEEKDYDLICGYKHSFEHCVESCYVLRGRLLKEQAIAHFVAAMHPGTLKELGWETQGWRSYEPSTPPWAHGTQKIHRNFNAPPKFQVCTSDPRQGWHHILGGAVCNIRITEKYFIGTSCTVGKAEYEWANHAHIAKFTPKYVLEHLS